MYLNLSPALHQLILSTFIMQDIRDRWIYRWMDGHTDQTDKWNWQLSNGRNSWENSKTFSTPYHCLKDTLTINSMVNNSSDIRCDKKKRLFIVFITFPLTWPKRIFWTSMSSFCSFRRAKRTFAWIRQLKNILSVPYKDWTIPIYMDDIRTLPIIN